MTISVREKLLNIRWHLESNFIPPIPEIIQDFIFGVFVGYYDNAYPKRNVIRAIAAFGLNPSHFDGCFKRS